MNLFRTLAAVMVLLIGFAAVPNMAAAASASGAENSSSGDPGYAFESPPIYKMMGDLIIARPLLIAATVVGTTAVFVVSLPFSAAGGNVGEAGQALVVEPGKAAFVRCLGCTTSGYKHSNANSDNSN
ncbi:MAG: hypothetical protein GAK43_00620 [Stenotrophomonas maltophilia]|nr:MAG: hypothetical protein GAK43_00620 [Stenotrophomonas maltophilia]